MGVSATAVSAAGLADSKEAAGHNRCNMHVIDKSGGAVGVSLGTAQLLQQTVQMGHCVVCSLE